MSSFFEIGLVLLLFLVFLAGADMGVRLTERKYNSVLLYKGWVRDVDGSIDDMFREYRKHIRKQRKNK